MSACWSGRRGVRLPLRQGVRLVDLRYQNAKSVLTVAGDPLPVPMAGTRAAANRHASPPAERLNSSRA